MKKEDLLLVFDFLATALKQDVVEEKSVEPIKEIFTDSIKKESEPVVEDKKPSEPIFGFEPNGEPFYEKPKSPTEIIVDKYKDDVNAIKGIVKEPKDEPKLMKVIKNEAVRVKEIMDMIDNGKVYPFKKKTTTAEDSVNKILREHQSNIASQISALETKLRDSIATPEQRRHFREFVKMENFKAHRDLDRIGYFLDNPGLPNPFEGTDEEPRPEVTIKAKTSEVGDLKIPVLDDLIKKSTVPQMIKDIMVKPTAGTEIPIAISVKVDDGQVKFKEEFKNGLGPVKKYGFDGQEIK